jgi:uncharacterized protein YbjT (DUF2867 family)
VPKLPIDHAVSAGTVDRMILITGATGTIGSEVLRLLTGRGHAVRAMSRKGSGPHAVQADFDDPASLDRAAAGVDSLFLLTAPAIPTPHHDLAMLEAAQAAGVTRVVKLSAIGTGARFEGHTVGAWHVPGEEAVRASGMVWTILRPSSFASNVLRQNPIMNMTGKARQGVVDPRDVAAVAVEALTAPLHSGRTYTLTGPELLSVPDQARQLSEILGHPVTTTDVAPSGMDRAIATSIGWARAGHNEVLTDDVARVLGRAPSTFATWARDHLAR